MCRPIRLLLLILWRLSQAVAAEPARTAAGAIEWRAWSEGIFEQARRENRFVLLDLDAVWCHWCHVMDEITYRDPKVIELIKARYLAVRVDQDSRPDLPTDTNTTAGRRRSFSTPMAAES